MAGRAIRKARAQAFFTERNDKKLEEYHEKNLKHVSKVLGSLRNFSVDFGLVIYTGDMGRPIRRIDPSGPEDLFFQQSVKKHLQEYEVWEAWETAKPIAKFNLDTNENLFKQYEMILIGGLERTETSLLPSEQSQDTPYYLPRQFRNLLLETFVKRVIEGKQMGGPAAISQGEGKRSHIEWDGKIVGAGEHSQCQKIADLGNTLLASDEMHELVRKISDARNAHEQFRVSNSLGLKKMVDEQVIIPVEAELHELKGKCYACPILELAPSS